MDGGVLGTEVGTNSRVCTRSQKDQLEVVKHPELAPNVVIRVGLLKLVSNTRDRVGVSEANTTR